MDRSVTHASFTLERAYPAPPARVFAAWADPAVKARWFGGGTGEGTTSSTSGWAAARWPAAARPGCPVMTFETFYREIVVPERIVYTSTMSSGADVITISLTTVEFKAADGGTKLVLTEQGAFLDGREEPAWRENGTADQLKALAAVLETSWRAMADLHARLRGSGRRDGGRRDRNRPADRGPPARPGGRRRRRPAWPTRRAAPRYEPGTLFFAASAAKGVAASLAHVLAEQDLLDYDLRLADVWPEFAAQGQGRQGTHHAAPRPDAHRGPARPARRTPPQKTCATGIVCARRSPPPNPGGSQAPGSATTR